MTAGIYQILNVTDGRVYIGQSTNIPKRWRDHRRNLERQKHHNSALQAAWTEHGAGRFLFEIIETLDTPTRAALAEAEERWHATFGTRHPYNWTMAAGRRTRSARGHQNPIGKRLPRLRFYRTQRQLSQRALAALSGARQSTISKLERGSPARFATVKTLAAALDVTPGELIGDPKR